MEPGATKMSEEGATPDDEIEDWTGPLCSHYSGAGDCELLCASCGHAHCDISCQEKDCPCLSFEDPE